MRQKKNIEELFQNTFENFEPQVDPSVWQGIQSQVGKGTTGASGAGSLGIAKIASVILVAAAVGTGVGYYVGSDTPKEKETKVVSAVEETTQPKEEKELNPTDKNDSKQDEIMENIGLVNEFEKKEEKQKKAIQQDKLLQEKQEVTSSGAPETEIETKKNPETEETNLNEKQKTEENTLTHHESEKEESQVPPKLRLLINASPVGGAAPLIVSFTAEHNGHKILWDFGDGKTSTEEKPTHVFNEPGIYVVSATTSDKKGHEKTASVQIEVESTSQINIPNIFTPNGDGVNDKFEIECTDISAFNVKIFDLDGQLLFESNSWENQWDGSFMNGSPAPAGNYYYVVIAKGADGKKYSEKGILRMVR